MEKYAPLLPNTGVVVGTVPDDTFQTIRKMAAEKFDDPNKVSVTPRLVGQIQHGYEFGEVGSLVCPLVLELCEYYVQNFGIGIDHQHVHGVSSLQCDIPWINYQYKHEFNPIHQHNGLFSYVLWVEIPYTEQQERAVAPGQDANEFKAGLFTFHYSDLLGSRTSFAPPLDTLQGTLAVFPSKMSHSVNPFYSTDKPRVTIAGNVYGPTS